MTDIAHHPGSCPSRPMRADARRNYDRIVVAAQEVFAESGTSASLDEIARRAAVGAGTLYRHFPTRETLLLVVTQNAFHDLHRRATELMDASDPAAALEEYAAFWLAHTLTYKGVAAEVMNDALDSDQTCAPSCLLAQQDSRFLLQRAQDAGTIRSDVTHKDIWRLFNGVVMGTRDAEVSQEESRRLFDVILKGLRT